MKTNLLLLIFFLFLGLLAIIFVIEAKMMESYADVSIRWPRYPPVKNWYFKTGAWFPWWNSQVGTTRNMSYDLRGDPVVIPRDYTGPWNASSLSPIHNKPLWMVS